MNEPIMWKPDIVSAILPDPTASLSENTEPEEDKLSDQEIFSPEISMGNVASTQDELYR
jgi:hypothetical protein